MKVFVQVLVLLSALTIVNKCAAQGENNIWYFGTHAGLDFTNGIATPISGGNTNSLESSASVCSRQGAIVFYSDGNTVWNKNNGTMPNGTGILGNGPAVGGAQGSAAGGVAIVPFVTDTNKYYLFTLDDYESYSPTYPAYLRYSVIDISLNGGLGDVVAGQKNIVLDSFVGECMISVMGSGCFQWLITHKRESLEFRVYKIDGNGLELPPVSSFAGNLNVGLNSYFNGGLAISPDNTRLAVGESNFIFNGRGVELCSFNNTTGVVSGGTVIDSGGTISPYSECFSPDGTKLYVTSTSSVPYQYNLSLLPNIAAVLASKTSLGILGGYGALRQAPDGKIYTHTFSLSTLSCIANPNVAGAGCNWTLYSVPSYGGNNFYYGLGYIVVAARIDTDRKLSDTTLCLSGPVTLNAPAGYSSYMWSDGSTQQSNQFSGAGIKWVTAQQGCKTLIDTFDLIAKPTDTSFKTTDTLVCFSVPVNITAPGGYDTYLWSDGSTMQTHSFTNAGVVWVFAKKDCEGIMDTIKITAAHIDTVIQVTDTAVCFQPAVTFSAPAGYDAYLWSDGSTGQTNSISHSATSWVAAGKGCNVAIDTFKLNLTNFNISLRADTAICAGDSLELIVNTDATSANYLWQDGSIISYYTVTIPDTYRVQVGEQGCMKTAAVTVAPRTIKTDFGPDETLCEKDSMKLDAGTTGANYLWQDGSTEQTYEVTKAGTYWVYEQLASCTATDTINISYEKCVCQTFVADAFTPNNDSRNDKLGVHIDCDVTNYKFMIFNRWGQQVFYSQNVGDKWDGTFGGVAVEVGTYYYTVAYTGVKNKKYFEKGDVLLIR